MWGVEGFQVGVCSIWAKTCHRALHWITPIWAALHQRAQRGVLTMSGEEITKARALRERSANLRTATAGLWVTLGREGCQPALRFSNQCVPCQLLAGRRGFWRNSVTSCIGHTAKEASVLHVLDWDQPWFWKAEGVVFYLFLYIAARFFLTGFTWLFLLIQLYPSWLKFLCDWHGDPISLFTCRIAIWIITLFTHCQTRNCITSLDVIQVCMTTAVDISCFLTRGWHQVRLRVCLFQRSWSSLTRHLVQKRCQMVTEWFCNGINSRESLKMPNMEQALTTAWSYHQEFAKRDSSPCRQVTHRRKVVLSCAFHWMKSSRKS